MCFVGGTMLLQSCATTNLLQKEEPGTNLPQFAIYGAICGWAVDFSEHGWLHGSFHKDVITTTS